MYICVQKVVLKLAQNKGGEFVLSRGVKIDKKGFTLIELMVVMVIIAILVGTVLLRLKGIQDQAKISKAQGEVRALKIALESYFIRWKGWPRQLTTGASLFWQNPLLNSQPKLINSILYDPFKTYRWAIVNRYFAARSPNSKYYVIWSIGSNGIRNIRGIDDNGNIISSGGASNDDIWTSNSR